MASAPDLAVQRMEMLLECCFCTETLTKPRTLSCFHSFCHHCLERFVATQREKAIKAGTKVPEIFECPVCRTEFHVKEDESVEKIPTNYFINNMLELLTLQQKAQCIKCQSCKAKAPAASRCVSCDKYLCGKCLEAHNNWPAFEDHVVMTMEELAKPENRTQARGKPRCTTHKKVLKFYCETCQILACRHCVDVNHIRPEHTWFLSADVSVQHKEALTTSAAVFEKQMNEATQSHLKIEHALETLKNNATKAKEAIAEQQQEILNALTKKLKEQTAVLLDQVDMKYNEANQPLLKQQANVKDYREKAKSLLDFAKNVITNGTDEEIISFKQKVEKKAEKIENERPELMNPVHNGSIEYQRKPLRDVLGNVNLNRLGETVSSAVIQTKTVQTLVENSTILDGNVEHAKQLVEWVEEKTFGWHNCYRASENGWEGRDFHRKCDDIGPTVTLVKCGTNVFGGYTDQSWRKVTRGLVPEYKRSENSFLFSLRNNGNTGPFKCPIRDDQNVKAICCFLGWGATFGNTDGLSDLFISNNATKNKESLSNLGNTYLPPQEYEFGTPQTRALLAGTFKFTPTEIEVFR